MDHEDFEPQQQKAVPFSDPARIDDGTNVFRGRFGLRAVWSILLFLAVVSALTIPSMVLVRLAEHKSPFPRHTEQPTLTQHDITVAETLRNDAPSFIVLLAATWVLSRVERRRMGVYGISNKRIPDFFAGAFWGFACLSLLVAALRATHVLVFDGRNLFGAAIAASGAKWLLAFLTVGLMEDYLSRGFLLYTFTRGLFTMAERISPKHARTLAFWGAAFIMSCFFGAGHLTNPGETGPGLVAVFLAGIVFSYALWWTGSLWWAIGFHVTWDWAQSFFYGVPDSGFLSAGRLFQTHTAGSAWLSGGKAGPEGSIFVLPVLLLVVAIVRFTTRRATAQPSLYPKNMQPEPHTEATLSEA